MSLLKHYAIFTPNLDIQDMTFLRTILNPFQLLQMTATWVTLCSFFITDAMTGTGENTTGDQFFSTAFLKQNPESKLPTHYHWLKFRFKGLLGKPTYFQFENKNEGKKLEAAR